MVGLLGLETHTPPSELSSLLSIALVCWSLLDNQAFSMGREYSSPQAPALSPSNQKYINTYNHLCI